VRSIVSPANLVAVGGRERPKGSNAAGVVDYGRKLPTDPVAMLLAVAPDAARSEAARASSERQAGRRCPLAGVEDDALIAGTESGAGRAVYFVEPFAETRDTKSKSSPRTIAPSDQIRVADILKAGALLEKHTARWTLSHRPRRIVGSDRGGEISPRFAAPSPDAGAFPNDQESSVSRSSVHPRILRAGRIRGCRRGRDDQNTGGVFTEWFRERVIAGVNGDSSEITAW